MSLWSWFFPGGGSLAIDDLLDKFLAEAEASGFDDVAVTSVERTQEEQDALYAQGRSEPGVVVTWTRDSAHVKGRAFDVTLLGAPEYSDDPQAWEELGAIGQRLGLRWGGRFQDYGHFEI